MNEKVGHKIRIPIKLYEKIEIVARQKGLTVEQEINQTLHEILQKLNQ